MNSKELEDFVELIYPYFLKKLNESGTLKECIKSINASVTWIDASLESNIGSVVKVRFPYDTADINVVNKSTHELKIGDLVCLHYNIDLKNAYVAYVV